jgi:hypothetical protein
MSQIIPIYIPTFISDQNYNPSRVLPHIYFYNGLIDCQTYYIESGSLTTSGVTYAQTKFPYFDNYNVVSGSFPTTNSDSLLFNNEAASYGQIPTENLYTEYWETYVSLLYNPKTRLLTCEAIIPLADYFQIELNDVVNFRGNYYHLRAINDYSLKTGECSLQLLGPLISDTLSDIDPEPTPPAPTGSTAPATASIYLNEFNSASIFIDANIIVSGSPYYFSGNFSQSISGGAVADVVMEGKDGGSTTWGGYTTASATLAVLDNGTPVTSSTQYIYSGSGDTVITFPTTFTAGHNITISGSTAIVGNPTPAPTGSTANLAWTYSVTGGPTSNGLGIKVNAVTVVSANTTTSGNYTVNVGDVINVVISCNGCSGGSGVANPSCTGIIVDDGCTGSSSATLTSTTYTVVSGDIGNTLSLDCFATCAGACL